MKIFRGKELLGAGEELQETRRAYDACLVDVGTGDGRYPYHWALEHPRDLAVGIDAVADAMEKLAVRSQRKPAKGGAPNLLLAVDGAEALPGPFAAWADLVTVNFPWGSLLRALVEPMPAVLEGIANLARPGARFVALLNASIFRSDDYLERLGLPPLTAERAEKELVPAYGQHGISVQRVLPLAGGVPHRTTWGQKLVLGSHRETLLLEGEVLRPNRASDPGGAGVVEPPSPLIEIGG
jgi:16S rRNA (adenine(1408)-N(1))-methyltransferase